MKGMKFFNKKNKLFPAIEPFDSGYITKGIHEIYYEQCGCLLYTSPSPRDRG